MGKLLKNQYSENYVRNKHPLIIRIIAIWRILTCRNFILIDFYEFKENNENKRKVRPLYRTDYNAESEYLTLLGALDMTKKKWIKSEAIK